MSYLSCFGCKLVRSNLIHIRLFHSIAKYGYKTMHQSFLHTTTNQYERILFQSVKCAENKICTMKHVRVNVGSWRWKWSISLDNNDADSESNNRNPNDDTIDVKQNTLNESSNSSTTKDTTSVNNESSDTIQNDETSKGWDIATYHGWDVDDVGVAMTGTTNQKVVEWDPKLKKIVHKVIMIPKVYDGRNAKALARKALKRAMVKASKGNPLSKTCKTCPICQQAFRGHNSMISHLLYREKCVTLLDPQVKEKLFAAKKRHKLKRQRRRLRRRGLPAIVYDSEEDTDDDEEENNKSN